MPPLCERALAAIQDNRSPFTGLHAELTGRHQISQGRTIWSNLRLTFEQADFTGPWAFVRLFLRELNPLALPKEFKHSAAD